MMLLLLACFAFAVQVFAADRNEWQRTDMEDSSSEAILRLGQTGSGPILAGYDGTVAAGTLVYRVMLNGTICTLDKIHGIYAEHLFNLHVLANDPPAAPTDELFLYSKLSGGVPSLYSMDDEGTSAKFAAGGISDIVEDTTPQLGGDLDMYGHEIEGVSETEMGHLSTVSSNVQTQIDGKVSKSVLSAKGSLVGASAASTPANVPVGSDYQMLMALASDAEGVVWKLKHKLDGTTAPTVNEDSGDGYEVGSVWIDTTNDKAYVCLDASVGAAMWTETSGGEANTASNTGSLGTGLFKQKVSSDLEFYKIYSANDRLTAALSGTDYFALTLNEGNIVHQNLSGAGTNTHAQVDTHIADAAKHREINDVGTGTTELWSASKINTELAGKGGLLTVQEEDGGPSDAAVTVIKVPNNSLDIPSAGTVNINPWDITERFHIYEEFVSTVLPARWNSTGSGTGSSVTTLDLVNGVIRLTSGTTAGGERLVYLGSASIHNFAPANNIVMEARVRTGAMTDNVRLQVGFTTSLSYTASEAKATFYAANGINSGFWIGYSSTSAGNQSFTSAIDPTAWHTLRIEVSSSAVNFYIDGSLLGTAETYVPNNNLLFILWARQFNNVSNYLDADVVYIEQDR